MKLILSNLPLSLTCFFGLTLFGGQLYELLIVDTKWSKKPSLIQPKSGGLNRQSFWRPITILFELCAIYSIYCYQNQRDVLLPMTVGAFSQTFQRILDHFYFNKKSLEFEKSTEAAVTEVLANSFIKKSRVRLPLSFITNICFFEALLTLIRNNYLRKN